MPATRKTKSTSKKNVTCKSFCEKYALASQSMSIDIAKKFVKQFNPKISPSKLKLLDDANTPTNPKFAKGRQMARQLCKKLYCNLGCKGVSTKMLKSASKAKTSKINKIKRMGAQTYCQDVPKPLMKYL